MRGLRLLGVRAARRRWRAFFEGLIRDHLDLGRPGQVFLLFGREAQLTGLHPTPGIGQDMRSFILS